MTYQHLPRVCQRLWRVAADHKHTSKNIPIPLCSTLAKAPGWGCRRKQRSGCTTFPKTLFGSKARVTSLGFLGWLLGDKGSRKKEAAPAEARMRGRPYQPQESFRSSQSAVWLLGLCFFNIGSLVKTHASELRRICVLISEIEGHLFLN